MLVVAVGAFLAGRACSSTPAILHPFDDIFEVASAWWTLNISHRRMALGLSDLLGVELEAPGAALSLIGTVGALWAGGPRMREQRRRLSYQQFPQLAVPGGASDEQYERSLMDSRMPLRSRRAL